MTILTIVLNVLLIPPFGTVGAAMGTIASSTIVAAFGIRQLFSTGSVINFHRGMDTKPDFVIIRSLFRYGLPTGVQGIAIDRAGTVLRFIGSLEHRRCAGRPRLAIPSCLAITDVCGLMRGRDNAVRIWCRNP
jgi:Na+-driven multidrug efflux pump